MPDVVVDVEAVVVDPDRVVLERDVAQLLAVARDLVQQAGGQLLEGLSVDAAIGLAQGPGLQNLCGGDMHVGVRLLEYQKRIVERRQTVVGVAGHEKLLRCSWIVYRGGVRRGA